MFRILQFVSIILNSWSHFSGHRSIIIHDTLILNDISNRMPLFVSVISMSWDQIMKSVMSLQFWNGLLYQVIFANQLCMSKGIFLQLICDHFGGTSYRFGVLCQIMNFVLYTHFMSQPCLAYCVRRKLHMVTRTMSHWLLWWPPAQLLVSYITYCF